MTQNSSPPIPPQPSRQPPAPGASGPQDSAGRGTPVSPAPFDELTFNTTPNQLTLLRILFVPVVVGLLFLRQPFWDLMASLAFIVASITDYFDGYLARTRQVVTVYGKLLDPLADKFLVVSSLIMLQEMGRIHPVVVILLICRELAITGLRAMASAEGLIIAASRSAKWKTGTQMVAVPLLMAGPPVVGNVLYWVGMGLLYLSLAISLWSAQDYIVDFFRAIREQRRHKQQERRNARQARLAARSARLAAKAARHSAAPSGGTGPEPNQG